MIDQINRLRDLLDTIELFYAQDAVDRADALMITFKHETELLQRSLWLEHHQSGVGRV